MDHENKKSLTCKWMEKRIYENNVLDIVLRDTLDQPQRIEKLEKNCCNSMQFIIQGKSSHVWLLSWANTMCFRKMFMICGLRWCRIHRRNNSIVVFRCFKVAGQRRIKSRPKVCSSL